MRLNQLRKRSLKELDDVIEEILARNPDFMIELDKILDGDSAKPHQRCQHTDEQDEAIVNEF